MMSTSNKVRGVCCIKQLQLDSWISLNQADPSSGPATSLNPFHASSILYIPCAPACIVFSV